MKKNILTILAICLLYFINPLQTKASNTNGNKEVEAKTAQTLLNRITVIQQLDMTSLTKVEKENLSKEVRNIQSELNTLSDGVYLSVGTLIIIVILLIVLL